MKKRAKKIVVARKKDSKGLTITAQQLKFAAGLFFAIIIAYGMWWFFFHNYYERIAEQNVANLYNAIDFVCKNREETTINFNLPQSAGFKGWTYQTLGVPGANVGTDPYFYVYYEEFPSYRWSLWEGYIGTVKVTDPISALIAPWSEDMPWTSNLMTTLAIDIAFMGMSPGYGKLRDAWKKVGGRIQNALAGSEKISSLVKAGRIIFKAGKAVIPELKHFVEAEIAGTLLCIALTDLTLGECATYVAVAYPIARATTYIAPKVISRLKENARISAAVKLEDMMNRVYEETADEGYTFVFEDLKNQGKIEEIAGKIYVKDEAMKDAIYLFARDQGSPEILGNFRFTAEGIEIDKDSFLRDAKEKIKEPWNRLKSMVGDAFGDEALSGEGLHTAANQIEYVAQDKELSWQIVKGIQDQGYDAGVWSKEDAQKYLRKLAEKMRKAADEGSVMLLPKDSGIANIIQRGADPETISSNFLEYLKDLPNDPKETVKLHHLQKGARFSLSEQLKQKLAPYGYLFLRFQDLYTPAGVSYWDKQLSFYQYTGTYCEEKELCLQMGFYVRKYPLPASCVERGIENIKLVRSSIVASNPRFYLVSPCFSNLKIKIDQNEPETVYIEPTLCRNKPSGFEDVPNYCYATEGVVNYYVSSEVAAWFADCAVAIACNALTFAQGGAGAIDVARCLLTGAAPELKGAKYATLCGVLGQGARLILDVTRDTVTTYPYIPEAIQDRMGTCG